MARKDPTDHYSVLGVDRRASKDWDPRGLQASGAQVPSGQVRLERGLWHALGGAARARGCFHAASAAEEVLSDDAKGLIDYDVELARIEFERNARRQRPVRLRRRSPDADWFRPGLVVYYRPWLAYAS